MAAVVSRFPESRSRLMWHRYFMRPRNEKFAAALLGLLLAGIDKRALVLTAPYLIERGPRGLHPYELFGSADRMAIDVSGFLGALRGSLRWRTLVI